MASNIDILIGFCLALLIYSCLGLAMTARLAPRPLALTLAPLFGWAIHSVVALPLFFALGLTRGAVVAVFAVSLVAALLALWQGRAAGDPALSRVTIAALAIAVLLALAVAVVVIPKISPEGVTLAAPIFDHSKIAMIDEMMRLGVPPGNPFYGGDGSPPRLSYYYLWHFSAAELALLAHISGWEADAALAWFTAFATLAAMIGFAVWLSGRPAAAFWVLVLAASASARPILYFLFGADAAENVVGVQSGFGGWLFQTSWAPQHTASGMCAVLSIFLLAEVTRRRSMLSVLLFALMMAAGFESSTWIGGITLPLAAAPVALVLLARAEPQYRVRIVICLAVAALLALLVISPLLYDQLQMTAMRGDGSPIAIEPFDVLDDTITDKIGYVSNLAAYWLIFLPVEFPACYLSGLVTLFFVLKDRPLAPERRSFVIAFALLLGASLTAAWLLVSTLGDNNDLGWRAVLPAVMLLIVFSAVGLARLMQKPRMAVLAAAVVLIAIGLPDSVMLIHGNFIVPPNASSKAFAGTPALWQAVRRVTGIRERVANNPYYMDKATAWPVNISWALLADRRSCYGGPALVGPFSALSEDRQGEVGAQFSRVFDGKAAPGDVAALATQYHCSTAVVMPSDGAWSNDPFAASPLFHLVDGNADWRIYRVVTPAPG